MMGIYEIMAYKKVSTGQKTFRQKCNIYPFPLFLFIVTNCQEKLTTAILLWYGWRERTVIIAMQVQERFLRMICLAVSIIILLQSMITSKKNYKIFKKVCQFWQLEVIYK